MRTELNWIPGPTAGRLAIMPRPRGGDWLEEEVLSWHSAGVDTVVSLLTPSEVADLDLAQEKALCEAHGMYFLTFPIPDRSVPSSKETLLNLVKELATLLTDGKTVVIHCRQGIGRAALVAICLLVQAGLDPETATARVSVARGYSVPETLEQKRWIAEFVKEPMVLVSK
jgi:protein-tyrosine phosphatase